MTIKYQGGDAKNLIRVHYDNCSIILLVFLITRTNHDLNYSLSILESSLDKGGDYELQWHNHKHKYVIERVHKCIIENAIQDPNSFGVFVRASQKVI